VPLGLGEPGSQEQGHKQHILVFALFFALDRDGRPKKQSKHLNSIWANHRLLRESYV
jgi:hypothetical protein